MLRTTPLLRRLPGSVTWITGRPALPLLAGNRRIARLSTPDSCRGILREKFDWVINFDEDRRACAMAAAVNAPKKTGALLASGKVTYCSDSAPWFDLSLISRLGPRKADSLKYKAKKPYQHYLFKACGLSFNGEEYMLPPHPRSAFRPLVAIEARTGARWPVKNWQGCLELAALLKKNGMECLILRQRRRLCDYVSDINRCALLVSGDTLAMHIALALRKHVTAVFNCTSPWEIYGYGRLDKIIHPELRELFYSTRPFPPGFKGIPARRVFKSVMGSLSLILKKSVLSAII